MTKKSSQKGNPSTKQTSPARNVFLALTLVPFVIGIILIGAWVLDIDILGTMQAQVTVGIFFFLLAFTASNTLQKRWKLAAGWGLLAVADLVTLGWLNVIVQGLAIAVGVVGVSLLGLEFYQQYKQTKKK